MPRKLKGLTKIPEKQRPPVKLDLSSTPLEIKELGNGYRRVLSNYLNEVGINISLNISQASPHNKFFGYILRTFYQNLGYDEDTTFSTLVIKTILNNSFRVSPAVTMEAKGRTALLVLGIDTLCPGIEQDLEEYGYDFEIYGTRKRELRQREASLLEVG